MVGRGDLLLQGCGHPEAALWGLLTGTSWSTTWGRQGSAIRGQFWLSRSREGRINGLGTVRRPTLLNPSAYRPGCTGVQAKSIVR